MWILNHERRYRLGYALVRSSLRAVEYLRFVAGMPAHSPSGRGARGYKIGTATQIGMNIYAKFKRIREKENAKDNNNNNA